MNTRLILISFLLILSSWSKAQEWDYPYTQYTKNDGLPSNTIYCVTSDKNGILWLGTDAGVVRFDGSKFKVFNTEDGLPSNDVFEIVCDSKNRLWLTTFKSDLTYIYNEVVRTKFNDNLLNQINSQYPFTRVYEDVDKNIWIRTVPLTLTLISNNNKITRFSNNFKIETGCNISELNNKIYFISSYCTIAYDKVTKKFSKIVHPKSFFIDGLLLRKNKCYYINSNNEVSVTDTSALAKGYFKSLSLNWNLPLMDSMLWLVSQKGFRVYGLNNFRSPKLFLNNYSTSFFHSDSNKNIWLSTLHTGLFKLNSSIIKNSIISTQPSSLTHICVNQKYIITGNNFGDLYYLERATRRIKYHHTLKFTSLTSFRILKIISLNINKYLVATDRGVIESDLLTNSIKKLKLYHASIKNVFINFDSLIVLDNDGIRFNTFPKCAQFDSAILFKRFYSYCDYKGKKVVGSQDSLYYIDKKFIPYPLDIHFNYRAVDLTTKDSLLIATTAEKGVFFIKDSTVVKNMNSTNGFSSNTCYKSVIYKDELFTATNKGINIYNFKTDSVFQLFESDGLPSNTVFDIQVYNDTIYAATEAGLSIIPISAIPHKRSFPLFANPVITNGDTLWNLPKSVSVYSNQPITFILNALSFGPKTPIQYHYRINGIDSNFKITTDQNLNLSKLEYGNYFLEAFAINSDGVRSNTLLISLIIKPYFYQTKLFKGFIVLLLGLALFLMISYMIRRSKKIEFRKNEEKNKMIFLELNAWRSAINPHFLFNSLNAIQGFFNQQDSNHTNKFIAQFSSILRKTIDQSGKILNKIEDEIIYLTQYLELEKIKRKNAFEFHIHCENEALKTLYIPTLVIQNIVENSIKHGAKENIKGNILITFSSKDDLVFCSITDNGNGFKPSEMNKETSKGFLLLKRKLKIVEKLIGRYIHFSFSNRYDTDQNIIGTEAIFTFPKLTFDYDFYRSNHRR